MKKRVHFDATPQTYGLTGLDARAMNTPFFQSGDAVPPARYRDIGNGVEVRTKRDSVLPLDKDGRMAIYVPLLDRRSKRFSAARPIVHILDVVDELIDARLAVVEETQNGI